MGSIAETERSFGATAPRVAATAVPFAEGAAGRRRRRRPASTSPASARRGENTDFSVERIDLSKRELRAIDEQPYAAFAAAGGEMVMLSTAIYPAFSDAPAAFTRSIATGELRDRLGFDGVTVTDALETPAVEHFGSAAKAARRRRPGRRRHPPLRAPRARPSGPGRRWSRSSALVRSIAPSSRQATQRVLDLRAGLAPRP